MMKTHHKMVDLIWQIQDGVQIMEMTMSGCKLTFNSQWSFVQFLLKDMADFIHTTEQISTIYSTVMSDQQHLNMRRTFQMAVWYKSDLHIYNYKYIKEVFMHHYDHSEAILEAYLGYQF